MFRLFNQIYLLFKLNKFYPWELFVYQILSVLTENIDADIEYSNNLRCTLYNGNPGQNSTIIQFNLNQAQKKLKEEFFKQKWKDMLKKKIEFLVSHKHKQAAKNKRVIRCNINQQSNNVLTELLGDNPPHYLSSAKKSKKRCAFKRSTSTNEPGSKVVDSYVQSIKNQRFTPVKIKDSACAARRISYCDIASTSKLELREKSKPKDEQLQKSTSEINFTRTCSTFKTMETAWTDVPSANRCFITSQNTFITPTKKKQFAFKRNSTANKWDDATPVLIKSISKCGASAHTSDQKTHRVHSIYNQVDNTAKKSGKKLKLRKGSRKGRLKTKLSNLDDYQVKEKRLNIRNKDLHVQAIPYTDLKNEILKEKEEAEKNSEIQRFKQIQSVPYSNSSSFICTPIKVVKKKLNTDFCLTITRSSSSTKE